MVCVNVGKRIAVALAVIEEGHATYTVGELYPGQLRRHFSKIDLAIGTHLREYEHILTENLLEDMETSGIQVIKTDGQYSNRYYQKELTLKFPSKAESVEVTLVDYLLDAGYTTQRHYTPLHVRHLERMRERTGYILKGDD